MKYRPSIGITCVLASIPLDIAFGHTGAIFAVTFTVVFIWSTGGQP